MIILSPFRKGAIYAGSTCRGHNNPTLLVLRRASNHSPNLSPIVGKRLKKIIAEAVDYFYGLVSRDDAISFYRLRIATLLYTILARTEMFGLFLWWRAEKGGEMGQYMSVI